MSVAQSLGVVGKAALGVACCDKFIPENQGVAFCVCCSISVGFSSSGVPNALRDTCGPLKG